jgi:hypothetical protein
MAEKGLTVRQGCPQFSKAAQGALCLQRSEMILEEKLDDALPIS